MITLPRYAALGLIAAANLLSPAFAQEATGDKINYQSVGSGARSRWSTSRASSRATSSSAATTTLKFFDWACKNGDKTAGDLDYVPMPDKVKGAIATAWGDIKDASGKPVAIK